MNSIKYLQGKKKNLLDKSPVVQYAQQDAKKFTILVCVLFCKSSNEISTFLKYHYTTVVKPFCGKTESSIREELKLFFSNNNFLLRATPKRVAGLLAAELRVRAVINGAFLSFLKVENFTVQTLYLELLLCLFKSSAFTYNAYNNTQSSCLAGLRASARRGGCKSAQ